MNNYDYVSELAKENGKLQELSALSDWTIANSKPITFKDDLLKYINDRLNILTNKQLKEGVKNETISI